MLYRACAAITAIILSFACQIVLAGDFPPWVDGRVADPTGRYYVVWNRVDGPEFYGEWGPTQFTVAERASDSPAVCSGQAEIANLAGQGGGFYRMLADADVMVRSGDVVLGRGQVGRPPRVVLVSSEGNGFVMLDLYGTNLPDIVRGRGGQALAVFSLDGELLVAKSLCELLGDAQVERFGAVVGELSWLRGGWIDEAHKELLLVVGDDDLKVVSLISGKVRSGTDGDVLTGLDSNDPEAVAQALALAADRKLLAIGEPAGRILADPAASPDVRLLAAVALAASGDRRGADLIRQAAVEVPSPDDSDSQQARRALALRYLPEAVGEKALPILQTALERGNADGAAASAAFVKLSAAGVPTLTTIAGSSNDSEVRRAAIKILGRLGPDADAGLATLQQALADSDRQIRFEAALAVANIDPTCSDMLPILRDGLGFDIERSQGVPSRQAAAACLVKLGASGATVLRDALDDDQKVVRDLALKGLITIGEPAVDCLIDGLSSQSVRIRSGSAFVLGRLGPEASPSIESLRRCLADDSASVRGAAAAALASIDRQATEGISTLLELLGHRSEKVRASAAFRLGRYGARAVGAVGPLSERLGDRDPVAAAAAEALGEIGPGASSAVPRLIETLGTGDRLLRRAATVALGEFGPMAETAAPELIDRLHDEDWQVPHLAATALGQIGQDGPDVVSALSSALESGRGDSDLRLAAIDALAKFRPDAEKVVPALVRALGDPCLPVAERASGTLSQFGPAVVEQLVEALSDRSPMVRVLAAESLGRIGPAAQAAVPALIEALDDADASTGFYAEGPLVEIGLPAIPSLVAALEDGRPAVRRMSARVLGRMGSNAVEATGPLADLLDDPNPYVRAQASLAIEAIRQ